MRKLHGKRAVPQGCACRNCFERAARPRGCDDPETTARKNLHRAAPGSGLVSAVFAKGTWEATISVSEGKIEGLLVRPRAAAATTIEEAVAPLPVLVELRNRIEKQKKLSWDHVVTLNQKLKSLPSGMTQEWPDHSAVTVQTLAALMISISDNTATDAVIHLLGRGSLARYGASPFRPFLTTAETFRLKAKGNEALLDETRFALAYSGVLTFLAKSP